jgi:hypothetical protein
MGKEMGGEFVEAELLGKINESKYRESYGETPYLPFEESIKAIKESQSGDPSDPEAFFANDLHASVADKMDLDDYSQLKFYTAIPKSHLDIKHGIDGFFEIETNSGEKLRFTIDLSTRPKNEDEIKANALIQLPAGGLDPKHNKQELCYKQIRSGKSETMKSEYEIKKNLLGTMGNRNVIGSHTPRVEDLRKPLEGSGSIAKAFCAGCGLVMEINESILNDLGEDKTISCPDLKKGEYIHLTKCHYCNDAAEGAEVRSILN